MILQTKSSAKRNCSKKSYFEDARFGTQDEIIKLTQIVLTLDKVSFKDVLELTSPCKLYPIVLGQENDKELIEGVV